MLTFTTHAHVFNGNLFQPSEERRTELENSAAVGKTRHDTAMNAAMAPVDSPRQLSSSPSTSHATKRPLSVPEDPTEALAAHVKKCRVSSTPGELRLKRDLVECDLLLHEGVARCIYA
ncbi:unnamed protein product [Ectocarpus sp. 12 AP-2014]